jgi:K+-sensing histidine kinase KdpD
MIFKKHLFLFCFAIHFLNLPAQFATVKVSYKGTDTAIKYPKALLEQTSNSQILKALETKSRELETIKKQSAAAHLDDLMHHRERDVFVSGIAVLLALVLLIYFLYNKRGKLHDKTLSSISQYQSHELRSPLVKIMGLVAELKKSEAIKDPETEKQFQMLEASAEELDNVIHKIVKKSGENRD